MLGCCSDLGVVQCVCVYRVYVRICVALQRKQSTLLACSCLGGEEYERTSVLGVDQAKVRPIPKER